MRTITGRCSCCDQIAPQSSFASSVFSLACCQSDAHMRTFRQDDGKKKTTKKTAPCGCTAASVTRIPAMCASIGEEPLIDALHRGRVECFAPCFRFVVLVIKLHRGPVAKLVILSSIQMWLTSGPRIVFHSALCLVLRINTRPLLWSHCCGT